MKRRVLALAFALLAATPPPNQVMTTTTLVANQAACCTWKTSAPTQTNAAITWAQLQTYITVKSCYMSNANQLVAWQDVLACSGSNSASAHTQTFSGTAYSAASCNAACISSGGSAQGANPYFFGFTANVVNSSDPVTYSFTLTGTCSWNIADGAGTSRASGTTSASGATIISGTTGSWTLNVNSTATPVNGHPLACTIAGGSITSWY